MRDIREESSALPRDSVLPRVSGFLPTEASRSPEIDPVTEVSPSPLSVPCDQSSSSSTSSSVETAECVVCGDKSSGKHYGQYSCEGCKSFFKRSIRRSLSYSCRGSSSCPVDISHRNHCQFCRLKKCVKMGMRKEAVQRGRVPPSLQIPSFFPLFRPIPPYLPPFMTGILPAKTNLIDSPAVEAISEFGAQLLFSIIEWTRQLPFFGEISPADQRTLLQNCWGQLFLLYAAQSSMPPQAILIIASSRMEDARDDSILKHAKAFQSQLDLIRCLHLDIAEMNCVKAAVLFNPDTPNLVDQSKIESIQENIQSSLDEYCKAHKPHLAGRFGRILLRLPSLRSAGCLSVEQLFFPQLGGRVGPVLVDLLRQQPVRIPWPMPIIHPFIQRCT